jgi:membrane-associated phospholipid phosphatase
MLRLSELALFVSPFLLFGVWRLAAAYGFPSGTAVVLAAGALLVMLGMLMWVGEERALPPGAAYVPARLEHGRIVPGHAGVSMGAAE